MKTKTWILIFCAATLLCLGLTLWLFLPGRNAQSIQILSENKVIHTLSLSVDQTVVIETPRGSNTVTIRDGKVAVTQASCPDHHCMNRGFCAGGAQIVCLPNRLVIRFLGQQELDAVTG